MDRLGLINAFPTPLAFARMSRLAQKRYIEDLIQDLLNEIKAEQRQPDLWERSAISDALDCLRDGVLSATLYEAAIVLMPEFERAADFSACPANTALTLDDLERKLTETRSQSLN